MRALDMMPDILGLELQLDANSHASYTWSFARKDEEQAIGYAATRCLKHPRADIRAHIQRRREGRREDITERVKRAIHDRQQAAAAGADRTSSDSGVVP